MKTPFFPELRPVLAPMGSRVEKAIRGLAQATLPEIEQHLAPALEKDLLAKPAAKAHSRERIFSLKRTFWLWIWQVLQSHTACREVVCQVQALFSQRGKAVSQSTGAYCRARGKLPGALLRRALESSHRSAETAAPPCRLLQGRPLKLVDGSVLRANDTKKNRRAFPPAKNQFQRPGFPQIQLVALLSAASGAVLAHVTGSLHRSELRLLLKLRTALTAGDIVVGDRHFDSFVLAAWLQNRGVGLVARVATGRRRVDFRKTRKRLGPRDALFCWRKPANASPLLSRSKWKALPEELTVRLIRTRITRAGFRTRELTLVTTLLDPALYPAREIPAAYGRRWRFEMGIDDLKTTLGMEMLRGRTPAMLKKELQVFLTAHNLVRWLMARAARQSGVDPDRISFKGTLDAFRQWCPALAQITGPDREHRRALAFHRFLQSLAAALLPLRPGRKEPRAVKKRSKYPPMNKPRKSYIEPLSRAKRRRIANAKKSLLK